MPKAYFKLKKEIMGGDQTCQFPLLNSTGSATSYATNVFITTANSSYNKQSLLPVCNVFEDSIQELQF